ncbi:pleckstrin homology domain-containing family O member 2 isoform X2 [Choloepus didactylus]|uniref:pleckstrin homology domain-containing family O member 2 isoform X2 n=1 Tax=Choloepus didactylus TaxID=27675 RepID=UPI00189F14D7|nr:pleckstrin homology domain-containing family O member 2 isoform X2 [Choloepus didactylus]
MEEEGVKEGGERPRATRVADKAGWIKKSSGGFLGLWKDRYLLLCQAQLLVYENEDEQKCVETVELGSYEKCQDLRALLKRKHRFILLRSPGNKVSDIKFQAPSGEEKDSWIKALNEGINRGKNKAFDEVANAASDGILRLDLDVPDSGPPVFAPSSDVSAAQPQEMLRPPMPPIKPSPAPKTTSLGDREETPAGEKAPTPVSANTEARTEAHPESQEDSETLIGEDSDPNKVLNDRLKVSWENPIPEGPPAPEGIEASQLPCSETSEAAPKEGGKPPTPPPKILSEKLKASMSGMESSGTAQSPVAPEASTPGPAQVSVNGVNDSPEPAEPSQATATPGIPQKDAVTSTAMPQFHPRCSSLGDLLGERPQHPRQPRERLYRAQLEVKVASEQTEQLLNKVLSSEPAPVNAETLLSQAVEQLRQATQVLQDIRDLGGLGQEAPGLKERRKELATLYRRSAP